MNHRAVPSLALLLALLALHGRAGLPLPLERPEVTARSVRIDNVSALGVRGEIDLDVYNPNAIGLPLRAVEYELAVGGARSVRGGASLDAQIPARGNAPVTVGVEIRALDAIATGRQLASGRRDYRLTGTVVFGSRVGDLRVAFTHDGTIGG